MEAIFRSKGVFVMAWMAWMILILVAFLVGIGVGMIAQLPVFHPGERERLENGTRRDKESF